MLRSCSRAGLRFPRCISRPNFTTSAAICAKQLPPRPTIEESEIEENFLKGSGPGGQKINKTASAVQLLHKPTGIVVKSQATRSRNSNRKIARQLLAEKLEEIEKGAESRKKLKEEVKSKKKRSREKKARRKYRKLAEGKEGQSAADAEDELEDEDDEHDEDESEDGADPGGHNSGQAGPASDVKEKQTVAPVSSTK